MTTICPTCKLAHTETPCVEAQSIAMKTLLDNIGDQGVCRGCQAPIYWVTHRNGKKTPYTSSGLNHFIDCEAREQFKRKT